MKKSMILFILFFTSPAWATWPDKVDYISQQFLNRPYVLDPAGEGIHGKFDPRGMINLSYLDCQTYVNATLAMSLAHPRQTAITWMSELRYHTQPYQFTHRNHFVSAQQNPTWHNLHISHDITPTLQDEQGRSLAKKAHIIIDFPAWLRYSVDHRPSLEALSPQKKAKLLAYEVQPIPASITYVPIASLLQHPSRLAHIPNGIILEVVRPNWGIEKTIHTPMLVSHLGFVFRKDSTLYFRHASSVAKKVVSEPLMPYLAKYRGQNIGIHLEALSLTAPTLPKAS